MTTQAVHVTLVTPDRAIAMTATCTDDQWNALKDSINTKDLFEVAKGMVVLKGYGDYAAGSAIVRVRNTISNEVKVMFTLSMAKGTGMSMDSIEKFQPPIVVEQNDVIEAYCTVAGS